MRTLLTLFLFTLVLSSCSSVKRNQTFLAKGNYDQSISLAVKKLQKDKASEKNDAHIALLEEAFIKAVDADTRRIDFLKKENNPATIREQYYIYSDLYNRQELIRPLLPLYSETLGRNASFKLVDYSNAILTTKKEYLAYLYQEGSLYMNQQTIEDYRTAYNIYCDIEELQSNYKDVPVLKEDAHFYGTDFVFVTLNNRSGQLIPFRLEQELLDFNTYGLDDFWTQYHSERQQDVPYNIGIALNFRNISIAPERIASRDFTRTQEIKTGSSYKRNRGGEIINDEDGNPIKIDTYETITAVLTVTEQTKSVLVSGDVVYRDLQNRRDINSYPLSSEFIFENDYATYRGDKRALTHNDLLLLNNRYVPFPSNEQMVFDAGEDLKIRLKEILKQNALR